MGKTRKAKATPIAEAPESAITPGGASAKALVGGATDPYEVAAIVHLNPRHEDAILDYLAATCADDYVNAVLVQLAEIEKTWGARPTDHTVVAGRDELASGKGTADTSIHRLPAPGDRLPYDGDGWDGLAINRHLGQHDRLTGTDSDGDRCSFATAIAGQIMLGPGALARWLIAFVNDHAPAAGADGKTALTPRQRGAVDVLQSVAAAIGAGTATYGDLSWAQEATHAYVKTGDHEGTGSASEVVSPSVESYTSQGDKVVTSTEDVISAASSLTDGGRMMFAVVGVRVDDNSTYSHQLAFLKQGGALYLYDPEWITGVHLAKGDKDTLDDRYLDTRVFSSTAFILQGTVNPKAGLRAP